MPNLSVQKVNKITREVSKNAGRTVAEIYSGSDFKKRSKTALITGHPKTLQGHPAHLK